MRDVDCFCRKFRVRRERACVRRRDRDTERGRRDSSMHHSRAWAASQGVNEDEAKQSSQSGGLDCQGTQQRALARHHSAHMCLYFTLALALFLHLRRPFLSLHKHNCPHSAAAAAAASHTALAGVDLCSAQKKTHILAHSLTETLTCLLVYLSSSLWIPYLSSWLRPRLLLASRQER